MSEETDIWAPKIDDLIDVEEGPPTNDPDDPGHMTVFGITENVARENGYVGPMLSMSRATAVSIYRNKYITVPQWDLLAKIDAELALHCFDAGVNCGIAAPARWLQRSLNALNYQSRWHDLDVDGEFWGDGRMALQAFYAQRGRVTAQSVIVGMLCGLQSSSYIEQAEASPVKRKYEFGWQVQRAFNGFAIAIPQ